MSPPNEFRCCTCGYGAVHVTLPHRCPMCGGTTWEELAWKPYAALPGDLVASLDALTDEAADAPLLRDVSHVDAPSIFPGVPFS